MLTWKISFEGCPYQNKGELAIYSNAMTMYSSIQSALDEIRSRIKYSDDVSEAEMEFLEQLRDTLLLEWDT